MSNFIKKSIIFLAVASVGYFVALVTMGQFYKSDVEHFKKKFIAVSSEKDKILDSLHVLKANYQLAIDRNAALSKELELEKRNVEELMLEIRNDETVSPEQFKAYEARFRKLKNVLQSKTEEITVLKSEKNQMQTEMETHNVKFQVQSLQNDTLAKEKEELIAKIEKAESLILKDFKLIGIRQKKANEAIITDKASKIDRLAVSFLLQANAIAKAGVKSYYVQIIDKNNTILGEQKSVVLADTKKLIYSFSIDVNYENKDVDAFGFLEPYQKRFEKGTYFLKVFDDKNLIGSSSLNIL